MRERLARTRSRMRELGVDLLLVGPSADLRYLTGYHALPLERLTLLVLPAATTPALVVPALEQPRALASGAGAHAEIVAWEETADPVALVRDLMRAAGIPPTPRIAVEDTLRSGFLLRLQAALPAAVWSAGNDVTRPLRARKAAAEVAALSAAGAAIDRVHERLPQLLRAGRTEAEVGRDVADLILEEHDVVNFVIVASGTNGASPHHETGPRVLRVGDPVVVDIGGTLDGYCSDMTRNYVLGPLPDGYREVHEVLERAHAAGLNAVRPGVAAERVDRACREVIEAAGYGAMFVHRTGHGIGLEPHEHPYLVAGNDEPLEPGMAFSVEPGIYLPGRYGARIEDIVVVTEGGAERVNQLPHGLVEVPL